MRVTSACLGPLQTNTYLVETQDRRILVDPAEDSDALRAFVGPRPVDLIIDTHGHFDHTGGNWAYDGVDVRIHEDDLRFLDQAYPGHPAIREFLREGEDIVAGVTVLHTPGHSPGSICLIGEGILIAGDLLFAGSIGRTDLPGGSMAQMWSSLKRIVALPGDYIVYPGHGPQTTLDAERRSNPFLQDVIAA